ncbi:MAG: hypothetical protein JOY71_14570 [Acetobacteraceae bacterium]|nr:hypothetical protein [Acetobacteraceae bacterium]
MALIAAQIEPRRLTRIFFDCRDVAPNPADQRRIEQTIERSIALGQTDEDAPDILLMAA